MLFPQFLSSKLCHYRLLTQRTARWQYPVILGEPKSQFSLTGATLSRRRAQQQIPIGNSQS
jgi:hypothetical protein